MMVKNLAIGLLLGAALLMIGIGLKNPVMGGVAMGVQLLAALPSDTLGFALFPCALLFLLSRPSRFPAVSSAGKAPISSASPCYRILAQSGPLAGQQFELSGRSPSLTFGRENCSVLFPPDTAGVGRHHCHVELRGEQAVLVDDKSTYGTFLLNPDRQLVPYQPYPLADGAVFCLARRDVVFVINRIN